MDKAGGGFGKSRLLKFALSSFVVVLVFWLLYIGQRILLPLVIALVFWFLINLLASGFARFKPAGRPVPVLLRYSLSFLTFMALIWGMVELIALNVDAVMEAAPEYQRNFEERMRSLYAWLGIEQAFSIAQLTEAINLRELLTNLGTSLTGLVANGGIILIYLVFLFLEQSTLDRKIAALMHDQAKEKRIRRLLKKIGDDCRLYISIKVFTSVLTGTLSYIFMRVVGVDFAEFWALLIFLLNFIPTVGSIIATVFPCVITLVQFDTLGPFIAVVTGITSIQIAVGNFLEPRLMGSSLNLSPMVILLNLSLWGAIWGVAGMFLCVPILVITMIVLSHIPQTRGLAIMLSRDGQVSLLPDEELAASGHNAAKHG